LNSNNKNNNKMKRTIYLAALASAVLALAAGCGPAAATTPLGETTVAQGKVKGIVEGGIATYWAIPFAEAPVGELRWKAPVPKAPWTGVRECLEPAGMPPQQTRSWPGAPAPKVTEDCLYLNIQTPAKSVKDKLPVLVWIHGGGFITGDANSNNGIRFAEQGIVYVSLSYRTGALGFLALPELTAENPRHISGNYGLLDMVEGLKWVKENIAAFGGDPAKVTIMGESAGAIAVSMLCASPLAKGLFRGAISESGGSFCPVDAVRVDNNGIRDVKGSEDYGLAWMKRIGVSSLSELRETAWEKLVSDEQSGGVGGFWPTVDGYVLPDDQYKMYEAGNYNDVNVLIGTNSDEGSMFVRPTQLAKYQADIKAEYGPFADRMLQLYPASSDEETFAALSDIFRETAFSWPTWAWATLQQKTGKGKVYLYYFDQFNENGGMFGGRPGRKPRGAGHASELPYVFGQSWGRPFEGADKTVSDAMNTYWANFVKTGDPNGEGLADWPVYKDGTASVMFFKDGTSLIETPNKPQLLLMEDYFAWKRQQPIR
jgi:para-nitrobenzyl esterase